MHSPSSMDTQLPHLWPSVTLKAWGEPAHSSHTCPVYFSSSECCSPSSSPLGTDSPGTLLCFCAQKEVAPAHSGCTAQWQLTVWRSLPKAVLSQLSAMQRLPLVTTGFPDQLPRIIIILMWLTVIKKGELKCSKHTVSCFCTPSFVILWFILSKADSLCFCWHFVH